MCVLFDVLFSQKQVLLMQEEGCWCWLLLCQRIPQDAEGLEGELLMMLLRIEFFVWKKEYHIKGRRLSRYKNHAKKKDLMIPLSKIMSLTRDGNL